MRQQIIQHFLAKGPANDADAGTIAEASVRALRLLLAELEPLVGAQAARALYARSLHLTRSSFDWLSPAAGEPRSDLLAALHSDLVSRVPADARRAGEALLNTFADLLISLIGEPLTRRLLRSAWGTTAADESSQEKAR